MEVTMTRRKTMLAAVAFAAVLGVAGLLGFAGHNAIFAEDDDDESPGALTEALGAARVTLQQGLTASEQEGRPISGKFEVEGGKLQLSVYTAKNGEFYEVLVDYTSGKVAKVEQITKGDDLAAANSQSAAMGKAKSSLKDAIDKAIGEAAGSRAVSVVPSLKDDHPVATVLLLIGGQFKMVDERLE
jgi:hypothetical protein